MKTMSCKQLGGACDLTFQAETFAEMAELSKKHGMEMYKKGDPAHLKAISEMQELIKAPGAMNKWFTDKKAEYDELAED